MTTVRGTVRSTADWEGEGSGPTAAAARAEAVRGLPDGFALVDVRTLSAKPGEPVTMKAFGRGTASHEIEARGDDEPEALAALREAVPPGHLLLEVVIVPDGTRPSA
ncbi:MAG TPA: hypothetical protein VFQ96_06350 [Microbacteriaceae bacterium]|nr:hypothetical protein [Microbacteriaceae bacterium]